ncbi:hypothetical protein GC176_17475 [bacterium]|nr:hypothetical protein [bacterium]
MKDSHEETSRRSPSTFHLRRRTAGSFLLVPSVREGRAIRCQGQLEGRTALILAACPTVKRCQEQPRHIWYEWDTLTNEVVRLFDKPQRLSRSKARLRTSYIVPDFLVETRHTRRLIEVKPSGRLHRPDTKRKLSVARRFAEHNRMTFHVVTELHLSCQPLLDNVRQLSRYSGFQPDCRLIREILDAVPNAGASVRELASHLNQPDNVFMWHILHLLATHKINTDLVHHPLNPDSHLYPEGVLEWDPFESVWAPNGSLTDGPGESSVSLMQND